MKKIAIAIFISVLMSMTFYGCKTNSDKKFDSQTSIQTYQQQNQNSNFSKETYIWESWFFSTNRVNGVK